MGSNYSPTSSDCYSVIGSKSTTTTTIPCNKRSSSMFVEEDEVNRKVMEILRRMTSELPAQSSAENKPLSVPRLSKPVFKTYKPTTSRRIVTTQQNPPHLPGLTTLIDSKRSRTTTATSTTPSSTTTPITTSNAIHRCSCSRSGCLKLYCECFAAGAFCGDCSCVGCFNLLLYEDHRQKAIERIVTRKPDAFQSKIGHVGEQASLHVRGCNCKRSGCLKNYCECFEARVRCTSRCRCKYCYNVNPKLRPPSGTSESGQSLHVDTPKTDGLSETNLDEKSSSNYSGSVDSISPINTSLTNTISGWDVKPEPKDSSNEVTPSDSIHNDPVKASESGVSKVVPTTSPRISVSLSEAKNVVSIEQFQILCPTNCIPRALPSFQPLVPTTVIQAGSVGKSSQIPLPTPIIPTTSLPPLIPPKGMSAIKLVNNVEALPHILAALTKPTSSPCLPAAVSSNVLSTFLALVSNGSIPIVTPQTLNTFSSPTVTSTSTPNPNPSEPITTCPVSSEPSTAVVNPLTPCTELPSSIEDHYTAEELATFEHLLRQRRPCKTPEESMGCTNVEEADADTPRPCEEVISQESQVSCTLKESRSSKSRRLRSLYHRVNHLSHQLRYLRRTVFKQNRIIRHLLRRCGPVTRLD